MWSAHSVPFLFSGVYLELYSIAIVGKQLSKFGPGNVTVVLFGWLRVCCSKELYSVYNSSVAVLFTVF